LLCLILVREVGIVETVLAVSSLPYLRDGVREVVDAAAQLSSAIAVYGLQRYFQGTLFIQFIVSALCTVDGSSALPA
jgi:hypothetical protein